MSVTNPVLVKTVRGNGDESLHRGSYVVVDANGKVIESTGDYKRLVYPRSSVKMLQIIPMIESGAKEHFQVSNREVSLACASHIGSNIHKEAVQSWLSRMGIDESALQCGSHRPMGNRAAKELLLSGEKPNQLHNACSGKHTGFLTTCLHKGWDIAQYNIGHSDMQNAVKDAVESMTEYDTSPQSEAIDGCSIPALQIPLFNVALAMAKFANPESLDSQRRGTTKLVIESIREFPEMLAGDGTFDTEIVLKSKGDVITKMGAGGMHIGIMPTLGLGVAVKMEDGSNPAAELVILEVMHRMKAIDDNTYEAMNPVRPVMTYKGQKVGETKVAF